MHQVSWCSFFLPTPATITRSMKVAPALHLPTNKITATKALSPFGQTTECIMEIFFPLLSTSPLGSGNIFSHPFFPPSKETFSNYFWQLLLFDLIGSEYLTIKPHYNIFSHLHLIFSAVTPSPRLGFSLFVLNTSRTNTIKCLY